MFALLLSVVATPTARAEEIALSGRLMDVNGEPLDGLHDIEVEFFNGPVTLGDSLFTRSANIQIEDGYFHFTPDVPVEGTNWVDPHYQVRVDSAVLEADATIRVAPMAIRSGRVSNGTAVLDDTGLDMDGGNLDFANGTATFGTGSSVVVTDAGSLQVDGAVSFGQGLEQRSGARTYQTLSSSCTEHTWTADFSLAPSPADSFLDIQMAFSHCGGGCHYTYREWRGFFNHYDETFTVHNETAGTGDAGSWSITRLDPGGDGSFEQFRIHKSAGDTPANYCGDVYLSIGTSGPLSVVSVP